MRTERPDLSNQSETGEPPAPHSRLQAGLEFRPTSNHTFSLSLLPGEFGSFSRDGRECLMLPAASAAIACHVRTMRDGSGPTGFS